MAKNTSTSENYSPTQRQSLHHLQPQSKQRDADDNSRCQQSRNQQNNEKQKHDESYKNNRTQQHA